MTRPSSPYHLKEIEGQKKQSHTHSRWGLCWSTGYWTWTLALIFWVTQSWQLGSKTSNRVIFSVICACL